MVKRPRRNFLHVFTIMTLATLLAACGGTANPEAPAAATQAPVAEAPAATEVPAEAPAVETAATEAPAAEAPAAETPAAEATAAETSAAAEGTAAPAGAGGETPASVPAKNEAPMLAALVQSGDLPPLAERVPADPMVVPVVERIGTYGGEWTSGILGGSDNAWLLRTALYDNLTRWDMEWKNVIPNIAKSWEVSDDATTYTFKLREGMKWSDGKPFTSADILFWVEHVVGNEELSPGGQPGWMKVNDKEAEVTAPDEYTVVFKFGGPNGLFLQRLATPDGRSMVDVQAEYAKQFHIAFNDKANDMAKAENLPTWVELFQNKVTSGPGGVNARNQNPDLPTVTAWRFINAINAGDRLIGERNPYYWKVDPEGNQLPYLDRVVYPLVEDKEVLTLKALNGEVDMMDRHIATNLNKAVFTDSMEQGNYKFFETIPSSMNTSIIALNLTHLDPVKREIFNNKLFRQALSVAIDRQEIIDLVYVGQGKPYQAAPRPESEFYNEELATQFTEFDVDQANAWLDEAGYKAGADGMRTGPDGKPIVINIEVATGVGDRVDVVELVINYWKAVGIQANLVTEERSLFYTRKENNEHDANVWGGDGGLDVILEPRWYFPYSGESNHAIAWQLWYNNPKDELAQEPPAEVKEQMELYNQLKATPDPAEQARLMKEILRIAQENFYVMGISIEDNGYGIVKNDFRNVPETMFGAWLFPNPGPANPQQFFKEQ